MGRAVTTRWAVVLALLVVVLACGVSPGTGEVEGDGTLWWDQAVPTTAALRRLLDEYERYHHEVTVRGEGADGAQYVVFEPVLTGAGNKVEALVSTFLYGLMTRRVLVLSHKWATLHGVIGSPLHWSQSVLQERGLMGEQQVLSPGVGSLLCAGNLSEAQSSRVVVVRGNQYFAPLLLNNPVYADWVAEHFGSGRAALVFAPLARYLLRPKPVLRRQLDEVRAASLAGHYVVGLQVRRTEGYLEEESVAEFWRCAEERGRDRANVRYFLATDQEAVRNEARARLGPGRVVWGPFPIDNRATAARLRFDEQKTFFDLFMLSACDELVVTCGSSYGRVAVGLAGRAAWVVNGPEAMCRNPSGPADRCYALRWAEPRSWQYHSLVTRSRCVGRKAKRREVALYEQNRVRVDSS